MNRRQFWRILLALGLGCARADAQPARRERPARRDAPVWLDPDRSAPGGTKYHGFRSSVLNKRVSCLVWLPPAYEKFPERKFPVIYWLHGVNGNQRMVAERFLPFYTDALAQRAVPPAIVVGVNGIPNSFYGDAADGSCPVESVIIKDLIPAIDEGFRTLAVREGRLIEGFSMGGLGAARLGFKHPDVFGAVVINSPGPLGGGQRAPSPLLEVFGDWDAAFRETPFALAEKNVEALRKDTLIRVGCGGDDKLLTGVRALHAKLDELKIPHGYVEVPDVGHDASKFYERLGKRSFALHRRAFGARDDANADQE
jgi:enterochelin esterase-like enzyme